ncbi:MAG: hypothetical protein H7175_04910, partial [Burkholderiales bacterium]|nr:hypothetical protein [Anaerolineae bacterium]
MSTQTTAQPTSPIVRIALPEEKHYVGQSLTKVALRRLRRDHLTLVAIGIVVLLTVLSILAPVISSAFGVNYTSTEIPDKFLPIGAPGHLLGTDDLGRDQLSRLLYAGQVSLSIGFVSAILSLVIGVSLGVVTGYYGGIVDDITNWVITTLNSIPSLF